MARETKVQAWIRLGLAALVVVAAFIGIRMAGEQNILLTDVEATSHGGAMVGVTMTVRNSGAPDRLVSVNVESAKMALITGENVNPLPIPGQSTVSLAADGAHVMIGGLPGELEEGRLIPFVLTFENAGAINAKARFVDPTKMDGKMDHGAMGKMDHSMMGGMEYVVPEGEPAPKLSLSVAGRDEGGYTVMIKTENFSFSQEKADGPHEAGIGHGHLYVGGVKIGRVYGRTAVVPPLPGGEHIVRVTLNTNNHQTYVVDDKPVTATVVVGK